MEALAVRLVVRTRPNPVCKFFRPWRLLGNPSK